MGVKTFPGCLQNSVVAEREEINDLSKVKAALENGWDLKLKASSVQIGRIGWMVTGESRDLLALVLFLIFFLFFREMNFE